MENNGKIGTRHIYGNCLNLNQLGKRYGLILLFILFVLQSCFWGAGSYPDAEYYEFYMTQEKLIEKINTFKEENPRYKLFTYNESGNEEEVLDEHTEYFYHFYFYFGDIDKKVHCVITRDCKIGLTGIEEGITIFGEWKSINTNDLSRKENKAIKKKFETEILDKLGEWKHAK